MIMTGPALAERARESCGQSICSEPRRIAQWLVICWAVVVVVVVLAWRRVLDVPEGPGDVSGMTIAPVAGELGLALMGDYVRRKDRQPASYPQAPGPCIRHSRDDASIEPLAGRLARAVAGQIGPGGSVVGAVDTPSAAGRSLHEGR